MAIHNVPNWIRMHVSNPRLVSLTILMPPILLLILNVLSFVPQLTRTLSRKASSGISTYYVLFNLISTTEQFVLAFFYIVNDFDNSDFFVHNPINAGDWINLAQTAVVAIFWLIM
jgi:uncharacterized protein with PQ loop repeat